MDHGTLKYPPAVTNLECVHQGKVRDTFALPDHAELLLTVATDRISTHNVVHQSEIARKGETLTALTVFWMNDVLKDIPTHLEAFGKSIYNFLPPGKYPADLHLRAIIIRKLSMVPVEFVYRSRMAGSLMKDYYSKGLPNPYGIDLPPRLTIMSPFEHPIFTPTEKTEVDDPMGGSDVMARYTKAQKLAASAYQAGRIHAFGCGIDIIDGKFEIGMCNGEAVLADECLTPDACRFVDADSIVVGKEPLWLDKQFVREEAEKQWNGNKRIPLTFSSEVCRETTTRYLKIAERLIGIPLAHYQKQRFN